MKEKTMNYIILDMEWNQALNRAATVRSPIVLNGEIIQIGAIKADENFNLLDRLKINVRPKFYKKMNPYVQEITGISSLDLTCGESFPQAFRRFSAWCGEDFRFITWGFDDIGILSDNLKLHGLDDSYGRNYINLQLIFNRQTNAQQLQCSLSTAAESLGIPIDVQVHDAANDAYLTYEVCKKLDMALGIAEYAELSSGISEPIFKDAVQDVKDCKTMLRDKRVMDLKCVECQKKLAFGEWLFSNGKNCKTVTECSCGRMYQVKLKAAFVSEGNYTVVRSVFEASKDDKSAFEEKLNKKNEARERRKKQTNQKEVKEKNMKKVALIDLDGTLLPFVQDDFVKIYFGELCKKLSPFGYTEPQKVVADIWAGTKKMVMNDGSRLNCEAFWEEFRARNPEKADVKHVCDEFYTNEFDRARVCLKESRDLKGMIERLKNAGYEVVLSTNPIFPPCGVETRLKWVNLTAEDFAFVTHYDNSKFCKPNPKYFEEILGKIGRKPEECIVVGNSVAEDIAPAKKLGIDAFLVTDFLENPENADISDIPNGTLEEAEKYLLGRK